MTYNYFWHQLMPLYDEREAKAIARLVLETVCGLSLADIYTGKVNEISAYQEDILREIIKRLRRGEPVQYILREAYFAGRTFHVEPGVLIPRPETAELCSWIVGSHAAGGSLLDIGTGSGCIAVTLALELPQVHVTAWDVSEQALRVARMNASKLGAKVDVRRQDILHAPDDEALWDVIVSNPPYVTLHEKAQMAPNVVEYEPAEALYVPDEDPLKFYRAIAKYASHALKRGGAMYLEINPLYADSLDAMLQEMGFSGIETRKDANGKLRMTKAIYYGKTL